LGANRLSLGIQDFNSEIQELINRKQTVEQVTEVVDFARKLNYKSINFDLIYGLPAQTIESVQNTMKEVVKLSPDRIAYYSYAHVPWIKKAQKSFEKLLPNGNEKRALYVEGKVLLKKAGYYEIGMDHFAKTNDDLYLAAQKGLMHRNFMGYTTKSTNISVSLGISAISDLWSAFAQNTKDLNEYFKLIEEQRLPVTKGHLLTPEDEVIRKNILNLMCKFATEIDSVDLLLDVQNRLKEIEHDGMIEWEGNSLIVLDAGKPFIRNICMALDQRMIANSEKEIRFSQTV